MKRIRRVAIIVIVAALGLGMAHGALAEASVASKYWACKFSPAPGGVPWSNQTCCEFAGGSWVTIYDDRGVMTGGYCNDVIGSDETYADPKEPSPTPTPNPTTGTYTTSTSGTYQEPQPSPTTSPSTTTRGTTATTASR